MSKIRWFQIEIRCLGSVYPRTAPCQWDLALDGKMIARRYRYPSDARRAFDRYPCPRGYEIRLVECTEG